MTVRLTAPSPQPIHPHAYCTASRPLASAAVVFFGRYGDVSRLAAQRGTSRQSLYRQAHAVVCALDPEARRHAVRRVLTGAWRASSLVEGLNSVVRMHQARQKRLTQGLLDLKRLYWNTHTFRAGKRKRSSPY